MRVEGRTRRRHYLRRYWHIHAIWLVATLGWINAWNLINLPEGEVVKEFIAFAASLASLVLAIVAIFYSFVSNRDFNFNLSKFATSSERSGDAAQALLSTTERLSALVEAIKADFQNLRPTVSVMSDKVAAVHSILESGEIQQGSAVDIDNGPGITEIGKLTNGATVAIYLLIRAAETGRFFDIRDLFPDDSAWQGYCAGYLGAIESLTILDIDVVSDKSQFAVKSLGRFDPKAALQVIEDQFKKKSSARSQVERVDDYFELNADATDGQGMSGSDNLK